MNIYEWLAGRFSNRRKALSLYNRGVARARKRNHQGAIDDYTRTIAMRAAPDEMIAMALYHRALVHMAAGDDTKGVDDLNLVLTMDDGLVNVKTMARHRLAGLEARANDKRVQQK